MGLAYAAGVNAAVAELDGVLAAELPAAIKKGIRERQGERQQGQADPADLSEAIRAQAVRHAQADFRPAANTPGPRRTLQSSRPALGAPINQRITVFNGSINSTARAKSGQRKAPRQRLRGTTKRRHKSGEKILKSAVKAALKDFMEFCKCP